MSAYQYYLIGDSGTAIATLDGNRANDADAIAEAQSLLAQRADAAAIEIWRNARLVAAMRRNGERYTPKPASTPLTFHPLFDKSGQSRFAWQAL